MVRQNHLHDFLEPSKQLVTGRVQHGPDNEREADSETQILQGAA